MVQALEVGRRAYLMAFPANQLVLAWQHLEFHGLLRPALMMVR
jgi:hypothetical protein